jgi:sulfate adenylyltransferase subunit 1 (EFTu-like GTPase family)
MENPIEMVASADDQRDAETAVAQGGPTPARWLQVRCASDPIIVLPAGTKTTVISIDTLDPEAPEAVPPMSVGVPQADDLDVCRGDLRFAPGDRAEIDVGVSVAQILQALDRLQ